MISISEDKRVFWILFFAMSVGFESFIFRFLPFSLLNSIPLVSVFGFVYFMIGIDSLKKSIDKWLAFLILYGLVVASFRFHLYYQADYYFFPIIRQSTAWLLGIILFISLKFLLRHFTLNQLSQTILFTSVLFLLIGIFQKLVGHSIAGFNRVCSLFSEPSYFGDYLVLFVAPFFLHQFTNYKNLKAKDLLTIVGIFFLWCLNIIFVHSGMTLLKLLTLIICFLIFYPGFWRLKFSFFLSGLLLASIAIFSQGSYLRPFLEHAKVIYHAPYFFFAIGSLYDRFYPIVIAINHFPTVEGLFGYGFAGDYFEFQNLYPDFVQGEMLAMKPSLSFFGALAPKIIFYLGLPGLFWYLLQGYSGVKTKAPLLRVAFLTTFFSAFWGIPNFALPYFWFWLALIKNEEDQARLASVRTP